MAKERATEREEIHFPNASTPQPPAIADPKQAPAVAGPKQTPKNTNSAKRPAKEKRTRQALERPARPTRQALVVELDEMYRSNYGEGFPFEDVFGLGLDDMLKVFSGDEQVGYPFEDVFGLGLDDMLKVFSGDEQVG